MPKVSVIIPVYNVEKYLGECLDSILGQTLKDIEVLCVDDGSTDGSAVIIAKYAARDARVKASKQENAGPYRARAAALARATGEYVYFMDSDDTLDPVAFEELCARADRDALDQILFSTDIVVEGDRTRYADCLRRFSQSYRMDSSFCDRVLSGPDLFRAMGAARCFSPGPPLRFIRRSVLASGGYVFPDAPFHGDNYFSVVSLYLSRRACAIDRRYYHRRIREGSITLSVSRKAGEHLRCFLNVVAALCAFRPFAEDAFAGVPAATWYLGRLHRSLLRYARAQSRAEAASACAAADPDGRLTAALFCGVGMPLSDALAVRPSSVRGCLRFAFRRILERLRLKPKGK